MIQPTARRTTPKAGSANRSSLEECKRFLDALFDPEDHILFRPIETWLENENDKAKSRVLYTHIECIPAKLITADWLERHFAVLESELAHGFFGVCPRSSGEERATYEKVWQIQTVRCLWADIDGGCTPEEALVRIKKAGLPEPSIVVSTGHGVHVYWLFSEAIQTDADKRGVFEEWRTIDGRRKAIKYIKDGDTRLYLQDPETGASIKSNDPPLTDVAVRLQRTCEAIANAIKGDSTKDLTRLLRLPGTMNRKNQRNGQEPKPCTLFLFEPERRYCLDDFSRFVVDVPDDRSQIADETDLPTRPLTEQMQAELERRVKVCHETPKGERSKVDFALCMWAIKNEVEKGEVWNECSSGGKFEESGQAYFETTWANAVKKYREETASTAADFDDVPDSETREEKSKTKPKQAWQLKSAWAAVKSPAPKREVIIEGLIRRGEVCNIVAATKIGKSWLVLLLAMCVAAGLDWLGRRTTRGRVLLIDNELHDEEIQNRLANVARAAGIDGDDAEAFDYVDLRGQWAGIREIEEQLSRFEPDELSLVILDAKYRFFGLGMQENSNDDQTHFHNAVDQLARRLNCAIVMVHHSTKGDQGGKAVTDVGSGGSAQARTADCHLVIRPHEESEDLAVLDAAVRTFAPVKPQTIRWQYPIWSVEESVEPVVKQAKTRADGKQEAKDRQGVNDLVALFDGAENEPLTRYKLHQMFGGGKERLNRLLRLAIASGRIVCSGTTTARNGEETELYAQGKDLPGLDENLSKTQ